MKLTCPGCNTEFTGMITPPGEDPGVSSDSLGICASCGKVVKVEKPSDNEPAILVEASQEEIDGMDDNDRKMVQEAQAWMAIHKDPCDKTNPLMQYAVGTGMRGYATFTNVGPCPNCGAELTDSFDHVLIAQDQLGRPPREGDFAVCPACAQLQVFTGESKEGVMVLRNAEGPDLMRLNPWQLARASELQKLVQAEKAKLN